MRARMDEILAVIRTLNSGEWHSELLTLKVSILLKQNSGTAISEEVVNTFARQSDEPIVASQVQVHSVCLNAINLEA